MWTALAIGVILIIIGSIKICDKNITSKGRITVLFLYLIGELFCYAAILMAGSDIL